MRNKTMLIYGAVALGVWYFYQKQKGNNIFGQPSQPAITANNAAAAAAAAGSTPAQINAMLNNLGIPATS